MDEAGERAPASGPTIQRDAAIADWRHRPRRRSRTRLAELRIQHGLVQSELAALLDISIPRYSGIENATADVEWRWPTVEQAQTLSERFGEDVTDLWPFLAIGSCGCGRPDCPKLTFNGRPCRPWRAGPTELVCDGCGKPLDYRRPARIGERNWHRDCYEAAKRGRPRPPALLRAMWRGYCEWRRRETGTTSTYGKYARLLAPDGKKVGAPFTKVDAGKAKRILKLRDEGRSERTISYLVGVSKTAVHNVIANRQGVIDHFSLDHLV